MKNTILIGGIALMLTGMLSCTESDCHCKYYNEAGEEISNYEYDYEEMSVASCSDLNTIDESQIGDKEHRGFICE